MFDVKDNTAAAQTFWRSHDLRQRKIMAFFMPKINRVIRRQLVNFVDALRREGVEYARLNLGTIVRHEDMVPVLREMYLRCAYIESNYVLKYLLSGRKSRPMNMELKRIRPRTASFGLSLDELAGTIDDYFRIRVINDSAIPINATTRRYIKKHLLDQVDAGVPVDEAIEAFQEIAITKSPRVWTMMRARAIALTETTKTLSFGGLIGAYMSGLDVEKVWVTSDDEKVRGLPNYRAEFSHVALDGVSSALMGEFYNNEDIKFPGDPEAHIENTINCRCCLYYREKRKPKPRVNRLLQNFLVDFLSRSVGSLVANLFNNDSDE